MNLALPSISYAGLGKYPPPATRSARRSEHARWSSRLRLPIECRPRRKQRKEQSMLDVILLAIGLGFFAVSVAYAFGCERL